MNEAIERAHSELWRRFIDPTWHTVRNQAGLDGEVVLPTAEECLTSRPNAVSWDISVTDGSMFGGMYLEATVHRWQITKKVEDRAKARLIADGLMTLATVGQTKGFIARGLSADGSAHYAGSSNDQTFPWLHGMWRYVRSDVPDAAERERITAKIIEVVEALQGYGWRVPCDRPPFDFYGSFAESDWHRAPRLLFLLKMMGDLSGDTSWEQLYQEALFAENPSGGDARLTVCAKGMPSALKRYHTWTNCVGVLALRGLWELESDPTTKAAFLQGLKATVPVAAESLPLAFEFDNGDEQTFLLDWRALNAVWREQHSVQEVMALAKEQLAILNARSPRHFYEHRFMREPLFAAWVVSLCPDADAVRMYIPMILKAIGHFQFDRIYLSQFFTVELAYYRLKLGGMV